MVKPLLGLLLAGLSLALTPGTGHAQEVYSTIIPNGTESRPPSHVPLPPALGDSRDTEQLFKDRLGQSQLLTTLRDIAKDFNKYKDPKDLLAKLKKEGHDPQSAEFKKLMESELAKLTPKQKKLIQELLPPGSTIKPPSKIETPPSSDPPPDVKTPPSNPNGQTPSEAPTPKTSEPAPSAANEARRREIYQWLFEKLQGMEGLGKRLSSSPAVRDMVRDLGQIAMHAAANAKNSESRLDAWLNQGSALFRNLNLSRLANVPAPAATVALPHAPSVRAPALGFGGGAWPFVLWPMVFALVALIVWKLLRLPLPFRARQAPDEWRLGPWPVRPEAVATREELVRGFEHLSLLLLGRKAQAWNHHAIADQLGGDATDKRRAAAELAAVYEKARYAPADEALDAAVIVEARRDLCLLAGVGGA